MLFRMDDSAYANVVLPHVRQHRSKFIALAQYGTILSACIHVQHGILNLEPQDNS